MHMSKFTGWRPEHRDWRDEDGRHKEHDEERHNRRGEREGRDRGEDRGRKSW
jgi:hypothetical protein